MQTDTNKPLVLLVEDSEDDAFFFRRTFQKAGANCLLHHVLDGAAAVGVLKQASASNSLQFPVAMFLDLKMPVMNGFEVLTWLRAQSFAATIKVIVLSGSNQQEDKDRAMRLGASDYLVKPVKISDLQRLLPDFCPAPAETGTGA